MNTANKRREKGENDNKNNCSPALMSSAMQDYRARTLDLSMPGRLFTQNTIRTHSIRKNQIQSVIDTGLKKKAENIQSNSSPPVETKKPKDDEREYVLRDALIGMSSQRPHGTLAERIGLIQVAKTDSNNHLSEAAWDEIKQKSNDRQDSNCPCPICQEEFGLGQQVLLSCSHVFHRACLTTFEKFVTHNSNGLDNRTCPICRRTQYEKRIIYEGAKIHRAKCAARIQAAWRGYIVRQWYKRIRLDMSHIPNDERSRRKFYQEKLSEITDRIVASCDFDLNELFNEIDRNVQQARAIRQAFDTRVRTIDDDEWLQIKERAKQRNEFECSICKCSLQPLIPTESIVKKPLKTKPNKLQKLFPQVKVNNEPKPIMKQVEQQIKRPLVLLSCTHVFHATCLQMFEQYSCDATSTCPVCRTAYQKSLFSF